MNAVVTIQDVTKRFPGVLALDRVTVEIRPHEVVGLIGENGAGKSTLLKILSGAYRPDSGALLIRGEQVRLRGPSDAIRAGIGMVYQEQSLIGSVSVAENIFLGFEGTSVRSGVYRWRDLNRRAQRELDKIGSSIDPAARTDSLTFAERQMVEIAKALAVEELSPHPPVIVLDEPTAVLDGEDLETIFAQVERLRQFASVVFVSHRLDEVLRVSDRVYVLKDGRVVAEREPASVGKRELYRLMVGHDSAEEFYLEEQQGSVDGEPEVLTVEGLGRAGAYQDVTFGVRRGEVLGLAGVVGSGREAVCRTIFGAEGSDTGRMVLDGRGYSPRGPADAVRAGFGYMPAERKVEGIAAGMSVAQNMLLADPRSVSHAGFVHWPRLRTTVQDWIDRLRIKTPGPRTDIATLSGGNQQKVLLAKWLLSPRLKVLVLDHPTRGLDVGAKEDVYQFIRATCARGLAVVLLADTLEETIGLSHRIVVFKDGRISARYECIPGSKPSQVEIVEAMV